MSKGDDRERQAVELWQRAGYATYRPATVRFGENDIFGLFDLLAVSPSQNHVHGVQVKSNRATGINSWRRHTALWRALGWRTFYAVPIDHEGWRLIECGSPGPLDRGPEHTTVVDEREMDCNMGEGIVEYLTRNSTYGAGGIEDV